MVLTIRKDEYDRLLNLSKYSHNNVIVSNVAVIVQPMVEIIQLVLCNLPSIVQCFHLSRSVLDLLGRRFWIFSGRRLASLPVADSPRSCRNHLCRTAKLIPSNVSRTVEGM